jgi:hypothetical protein
MRSRFERQRIRDPPVGRISAAADLDGPGRGTPPCVPAAGASSHFGCAPRGPGFSPGISLMLLQA